MVSRRGFLASGAALAFSPLAFADDKATWDRLRAGGLVLLMRHASTTEGLGDPPDFKLGDCSTQRNLSDRGRDEARRVGERFRQERVTVSKVLTSPWCRCRDTATLAFGSAEDWTPLSSVFDFPHDEPQYSERVRKRIGSYAGNKPKGVVVMVTHNVNIAALSRHSVAPAEMVLMRPDGCCNAKPLERLKIV